MLKVTIVTISYNQAKYVEQTIRSIIEQDYPNIEYIVVDPGSTDGSRKIIQKYSNRIQKIIFEPDNGPADGLNKGFNAATGDIFGFVNSDDTLLDGAISKIVKHFGAHPNADIVYGNGYKVDSNNGIIRKIFSDPFDLQRCLYYSFTFIQPSLYFTKAAFVSVGGFNEENTTFWDGELVVDFGRHQKKFYLVQEFLSRFRVHGSSLGSSLGSSEARSRHLEKLDVDRSKMFLKVKGRNYNNYDRVLRVYYRLEKWLHNPRSLFYNIYRLLKKILP
jgi:glycosyltransferase involved in cell wall biosynthesis